MITNISYSKPPGGGLLLSLTDRPGDLKLRTRNETLSGSEQVVHQAGQI
jgi:hypothetical protein